MKYIKRFFESNVQLNDDFDKVISILERDCKPFLEECKQSNIGPILRGARPDFKEEVDNLDIYRKKVRTNRRALDTNSEIADIFDDIFERRFGFRLRSSGVFTTKELNTTSTYGMRYLFFPIGEYEYYWNPDCIDLYTNISNEGWYRKFIGKFTRQSIFKKFYDFIIGNNLEKDVNSSLTKIVKGYKNTGLDSNTNQEIIFSCKEYYLVNISYYSSSRFPDYLKRSRL